MAGRRAQLGSTRMATLLAAAHGNPAPPSTERTPAAGSQVGTGGALLPVSSIRVLLRPGAEPSPEALMMNPAAGAPAGTVEGAGGEELVRVPSINRVSY